MPDKKIQATMEASPPKRNIKALTQEELKETLKSWGVEGYRFDQLYQWLYQKDVADFKEMSNLSKALKAKLQEHFIIERWQPAQLQSSEDGTQKFLFQLKDGQTIESVLIPNGARQTLCLSSQVGCAMACTFCLTGTLGLTRHLTHFEIVEQILAASRQMGPEVKLSNLVFMGMGEPLHNLEQLLESLKFILDERGLNFSKNRVTVSTSGLLPQMLEFGAQSEVKLAVSLSGTTDEMRDQLIPINKKYPLADLKKACQAYPLKRKGRITFEYTLLKGVNDSLEDARRLVQWLHGIPAKLNLIPFNEYPGARFQRSSDSQMLAFQKILLDRNVQTNIRQSRGRDILGACGQLKAQLESRRGSAAPPKTGEKQSPPTLLAS